MNKIQFTINLYAENHKKLERVLSNISTEAVGTRKADIQVNVLDIAGSKKNEKIAIKYQEQKIVTTKYVDCKGLTAAQAYNHARNLWTGEYITFITEDMFYEKGAFKQLAHFIMKEPVSMICLTPNLINEKGQQKEYLKFSRRNRILDISDEIYCLNMNFNSYFIQAKRLEEEAFREDIAHEALTDMLLHLLKQEMQYGIVSKRIFSHNVLETDYYNYPDQFYKTWYTQSLEEYIIPTLKNATDEYVKYAMYYLIMIKFACNMNDRHKAILLHDELNEFYDKVKEALQLIPDHIISQFDVYIKRVLPRFMGLNFLRMKYDDYNLKTDIGVYNVVQKDIERLREDEEDQEDGDEDISIPDLSNEDDTVGKEIVVGLYKETVIEDFRKIQLYIKAINYENNNLIIDGELSNVYFLDYDQIKVVADVNGTLYTGVRNHIYSLVKYYNRSVHRGYTFTLTIPVDSFASGVEFGIRMEYKEVVNPLNIEFKKVQARLYEDFPQYYWRFGDYILKYSKKKRQLVIKKKNPLRVIKNEILFTFSYLKHGASFSRSLKCVLLRLVYWLTRPFFYKKQIWMTFDQLFKGGDNGEYFYRYVSERQDKGNIKIYYVINKTAPEYKRLKEKYGTVLTFNSFWHKVISLHTTVVFATRVDVKLYCGYWAEVEKYVRDLFNAEITCLQHGLTIQRIAQYQNRLFDNTKLYFCVSPYEIENLSNPVYGYKPEQLILTGAPRYDGLINNDQRYILISPTWRRNVTAGTNQKGSMHEYSENFKHTEYFRIYNTLINDKRLIQAAKENNYRIKYLIHPILSPQIKDFDKNDYVDIIAGAGNVSYEKMLTEASLMLTDHSGIQFDFANMRKPLVYFHPDTLPPQYEEGGLKYDTMGFGPVCVNREEVVNELCDYMKKNCQLKEEYRKRIDTFFAYNDTDNCKRVFEAAVRHLKL